MHIEIALEGGIYKVVFRIGKGCFNVFLGMVLETAEIFH